MPRRTNAFQKLILLLSERLGPAHIVESAMHRDTVTKQPREVDVTVVFEPNSGPAPYVVLECVDRSRRTNVEWVEQMCKKHEDLKTPALILASASGFTKQARAKANHYEIGLIEPDTNGRWNKVAVSRIQRGLFAFVNLTVMRCTVVVLTNGVEKRVSVEHDFVVHDTTGAVTGTMGQFVWTLLRNGNLGEQLLLGARAHRDATYFEVSMRPLKPSTTRVAEYEVQTYGQAQLQEQIVTFNGFLSCDGELEQVVDVRVVGRVAYGESDSADIKLGFIDGMQVAWGTAVIGDKTVLVAGVDERPARLETFNIRPDTANLAAGELATQRDPAASYR
jgi:hypothetical protein